MAMMSRRPQTFGHVVYREVIRLRFTLKENIQNVALLITIIILNALYKVCIYYTEQKHFTGFTACLCSVKISLKYLRVLDSRLTLLSGTS